MQCHLLIGTDSRLTVEKLKLIVTIRYAGQNETHEFPASASVREMLSISATRDSQESSEASTILYTFPLGLSEEQLTNDDWSKVNENIANSKKILSVWLSISFLLTA